VRFLGKLRRTLELPLLLQNRINVGGLWIDHCLVGHGKNLIPEECSVPLIAGTNSQEFILQKNLLM
jgi:hypothetical protein